jgi:transaldolase
VSIDVFADLDTSSEEMLAQGREMFGWIPNAYIKYPCTHEGLRAVEASVREGIRVNVTLFFAAPSCRSVFGEQGIERACVRIPVCRQVR